MIGRVKSMLNQNNTNTQQVVRSTCGLCFTGCGVLIHIENGKPIRIEGDPKSPINKGKLCVKGYASLEYLYHQDRLKHPLKRIGERGDGNWQHISWDEALEIIAKKLSELRNNYGAESVAMIHGAAKGLQDSYLTRFASIFGTPNISNQAHVCFVPKRLASQITFGFLPTPDFDYPPACIIVWGSDLFETRAGEYEQILHALDKGTKLIVIDPKNTHLAQNADLWIQVRPGSDLALALGIINVIVNEELFDEAFVNKWTIGFNELRSHIQAYPPEKVEEITWVNAQTIREIARLYSANIPACIICGNALEQNVNSFQAARAISILTAITGNLGVPGGEQQWSSPPVIKRFSPELTLLDKIPKDKRQRKAGKDLKLLPTFPYVPPQSIVKAILDEDPYPIRAVYIQGCNPLLTYSNAQKTYSAFKKLDFLAVAEMFMTPTASLADIVLPVATYLEFDSIVEPPRYPIVQIHQKVADISECWSDYRIINELAKKFGLQEYFGEDEEQFLDTILKPAGLTFREFRKVGAISGFKQFRRYEVDGFETPSRKVELYSSRLKEWGFDPLPTYYELPETPYSDPELTKRYPLIFTSWKTAPFRHSGGKQITTLRGRYPEPIIYIHPETANKLAIKEGDWAYVETKRGKIKQKVALSTGIHPRVVGVDYGWWFPEKGISDLYGWAESNVNILTDDKPPYNREMGSANLRGILCKVYPVTIPEIDSDSYKKA
jgi:thiosulfate reductase/polysulfide reductase chain A